MRSRSGPARVAGHLQRQYGISVDELTELDRGVFRIDRRDGPSWVARVFPIARPPEAAEGDAEILRFLQLQDFPAERCAHPQAVSALDGQGVLVTEFARGGRPAGSERTFRRLGSLLGQLHTLPAGLAAIARDGGAWHHLALCGGPREEIDAARALLADAAPRVPAPQRVLYETLRRELDRLDDFHDLPQALIHPDFVPPNVIATPGDGLVLVDWTGAGRGPRIASLGLLLLAAGRHGLARVDAVVAGYRPLVSPEPAELARLADAVRARALIFDCWGLGHGRRQLPQVVADMTAVRDRAGVIAARACRAFAGGRGGGPGRGQAAGPARSAAGRDGAAETRLALAAIRAAETARPDRLFADPLAGAFLTAAGRPAPRPAQEPRPGPPRQADRRGGDKRAAAMRLWVVARTVFLDELIGAACRDGCRQVVLLGAGLDSRTFRLAWPPAVRCFELDTAETLDGKALVLAAQQARPGCERIPVPCDLRADWPAALLAAGFTVGEPAAWIAEGLLVYLTREEAGRLIASLTSLSAPGSRLGLTMAGSGSSGSGSSGAVQSGSGSSGDPAARLASNGWSARLTSPLDVLSAHGRAGLAAAGQRQPRAWLVAADLAASRRAEPRRQPARSPAPAPPEPGAVATPSATASALPVLLSQVLVAYTIEFDNEFEHRMPHRTTRGPAASSHRGPWLVSLPMWSNFLQFIDAGGVPLQAVAGLARITNLPGLERWGYVTVRPDPADRRPAPPRRDWIVRPTTAGRQAQQVWQPLSGVLDERWRSRFGTREISGLADSLRGLAGGPDRALPCYLPVGGIARLGGGRLAAPDSGPDRADLPVLLSRLLLAFAIEFERESDLPMEVSASALRVMSADGIAVRDLPRLTGISKEAVAVSLGQLERRGYLLVRSDPAGGRSKLAWLTPEGRRAQDAYHRLLAAIEERWRARFGSASISRLRESLRALYHQPDRTPLLSEGLRPYPDGWRAHPPYLAQTTAVVSDPARALPHYPAVSHRGGFPDGS